MPGAGTLLTANAAGTSVSAAPAKRSRFRHPWRPTFSAAGAKLSLGLVEGFPATIGGVPMAGDERHAQPTLALKAAVANDAGESWICVEVEPAANHRMERESPRRIVHVGDPRSPSDAVGRCPLVLILWRNRRLWRSHQIVHFDLRYQRVPAPQGTSVARHLFF
jgi:hypothetical protein